MRRRLSAWQLLYCGWWPSISSIVSWRLCSVCLIFSSQRWISFTNAIRRLSVSWITLRRAVSVFFRAWSTSRCVRSASFWFWPTICLASCSSCLDCLANVTVALSQWPSVSLALLRLQSSEACTCVFRGVLPPLRGVAPRGVAAVAVRPKCHSRISLRFLSTFRDFFFKVRSIWRAALILAKRWCMALDWWIASLSTCWASSSVVISASSARCMGSSTTSCLGRWSRSWILFLHVW
mmetsp:Transcript_52751/g.115680  ORF Transcript_52751/g.115680 Transcript_52751/m.115680 type:complete len:236 (+) Transcript_52751:354-1061(+)